MMNSFLIKATLVGSLALGGCTTVKDTLIGVGVGAAGGAAIGAAAIGGPGAAPGAVVGAAVGGTAGLVYSVVH